MSEQTEKLEGDAYKHWLKREINDEYWDTLAFIPAASAPSVEEARRLLHLTTNEVARRLGISHQAYSHLEKSDREQKISIGNLRRIAKAMDCEVRCEIRPKSGKSFKRMTWEAVIEKARHLPFYKNPNLTPNNLAMYVRSLVDDPDMRKILGWNTRQEVKSGHTHRFIERWWCKTQRITERLGGSGSHM